MLALAGGARAAGAAPALAIDDVTTIETNVDTKVNVPVLIKGDALDEPDETFDVDLWGPEHATLARARGAA